MKAKDLQVSWWGVQFPLVPLASPVVMCRIDYGKRAHLLSVEAKNPLEAHFGLRWAIMKSFGCEQSVADEVVSRIGFLAEDDESSDDSYEPIGGFAFE